MISTHRFRQELKRFCSRAAGLDIFRWQKTQQMFLRSSPASAPSDKTVGKTGMHAVFQKKKKKKKKRLYYPLRLLQSQWLMHMRLSVCMWQHSHARHLLNTVCSACSYSECTTTHIMLTTMCRGFNLFHNWLQIAILVDGHCNWHETVLSHFQYLHLLSYLSIPLVYCAGGST